MYNIDSLNSLDFYFNEHWLSEYDGIIAGINGMTTLTVTPQLDIKTEKILGKHGELFYDATYQPRTFVVPVYFKDLNRIRDIASWLRVTTPKDFYFKNDSIKIKCVLDSSIDLQAYAYQGIVELKFIAHYPFYSSVTSETIVLNQSNSSYPNFIVLNKGNKESYPLLKLYGNGNITVSINGTAITINNVVGNVNVDMLYCTVYKDGTTPTNYISNFQGNFMSLPNGNNSISVSTNCTSIEITTRSEWI